MPRGPALEAWITGRGGVAHAGDVRDAGFSRRDMEHAQDDDLIRRARRTWLYTRAADAGVLSAVRAGGRLTCVSAARRAGLWVPGDPETHIAVTPGSSRFPRDGLIVHWSRGPAPVSPRTCEEPLINVLFHVAVCLSRIDALVIWESAVRTTSLDAAVLRRVQWHSSAANSLAEAVSILSDSGLETYAVVRLSAFGIPIRQQTMIDGRPVDLLIGERLIVQLDGEHHLETMQRRRDIRGDARLALRGYTVLRFDYHQVLFDWPFVEQTILAAVAQGRHLAA